MFFLRESSKIVDKYTSQQFLRYILPKVSRTFALNIRVLSPEEYDFIGTVYLICRFIDTIEDSSTYSDQEKISALNEFSALFNSPNIAPNAFNGLIERVKGISDSPFENKLIDSFNLVLTLYSSCREEYRQISFDMIKEMAEGMRDFIERYQKQTRKILKSETELEKYCYYVAGTVGVILTRFFSLKTSSPADKKILHTYTNDFGLALQMTNIVKDFHDDKKRGWAYVPVELLDSLGITVEEFYDNLTTEQIRAIRSRLISKIEIFIENSITYCLALPKKPLRYRLFCLIPLFLAIKTVYHLKNLPSNQIHRKKITKTSLFLTLFRVYIICPSHFLIRRYYKTLKSKN